MKTASIGSVSHGTMRPEDLIPVFSELLETLHNERHRDKPHGFDPHTIGLIKECEQFDPDGNAETTDELVISLFDALEDYSPPFCHFGANEGDGSDYGFWPSWDAIRDAVKDGEVWEDDSWKAEHNQTDMPTDAQYRLVVSDHGNATLYSRDGTELWGIV